MKVYVSVRLSQHNDIHVHVSCDDVAVLLRFFVCVRFFTAATNLSSFCAMCQVLQLGCVD